MNKKIIVIDLDGTFVSVNTFHKWMKFLFIEELKKFHFISLVKILKSAFLRYLKFIDHSEMKFSILKISEKQINLNQIQTFVKSLHSDVNPNIVNILNNEENITILATAAPTLYAQTIKDIYNFDYLVATKETNKITWEENIREIKKRNLMTLMKNHSLGNKISILYTDHHDDLPLMKYSDFTYLINASERTKQIALDEHIVFKVENIY